MSDESADTLDTPAARWDQLIKNLPQLSTDDTFAGRKDIRIVVLPQRWIFVGQYFTNGLWGCLVGARNIRRWGVDKGLGQLAKGPTNETVLDDGGTLLFRESSVVYTIQCREQPWVPHLQQYNAEQPDQCFRHIGGDYRSGLVVGPDGQPTTQVLNADMRIAILPQRWVYAGLYSSDGLIARLTRSRNVRRWGTSRGLGQLASGPTAVTELDDGGTVEFAEVGVIAYILANYVAWQPQLQAEDEPDNDRSAPVQDAADEDGDGDSPGGGPPPGGDADD